MDTERIMRCKSRKVRFVIDNDGEKWYSAIDVVRALTDVDDYEINRNYWTRIKNNCFGKDEDDNDLFLNKLRITASDGKRYMSDVLKKTGIRLVALDIALTCRTKGFSFARQNNICKAIDYYEKSVRIFKNIYGNNHIETAISQNILGLFYGKHDYIDKAHEYLRKPLKTRIFLDGEEDHTVADYYIYFGDDCREYYDYDTALKYYKRALAIYKKETEKDYESIADSCVRLAWIYIKLRDYKASLRFYKKALSFERKRKDINLREIASNISSIGTVYELLDDYEKALKYQKKALDIRNGLLGPNDPTTVETYINMGVVYKKMEEYDTAIDYYMRALSVQKKCLGKNDPVVAMTFNNLGNVYKEIGKYLKALYYHQKALDIRTKAFGDYHPETANSYMNCYDVLCALGDYHKALEYGLRAVDIMEKYSGMNSLQTADAYNVLGKVYAELGDYDLAIKNFTKVLHISTLHFGEEDPRTIDMKEFLESYKDEIKTLS